MREELTVWGNELLALIRSNNNINKYGKDIAKHVYDTIKITNSTYLKALFMNGMRLIFRNNEVFLDDNKIILATIYDTLTDKIIHVRTKQIIETYSEENFSRKDGNSGLSFRTSLKAMTNKRKIGST